MIQTPDILFLLDVACTKCRDQVAVVIGIFEKQHKISQELIRDIH